MRISIGQQEFFSARYGTFDEMIAQYRADEEGQGRELPVFALDPFTIALALWLLDKAAEKAIDWALARPARKHEREMETLAQQRHEELTANYRVVKTMIEEARALARQGDDIAKAARPVPLSGEVPLRIELQSGAEEDLKEAFDQVGKRLPSLAVSVSPSSKT
jgi:hypothetical protein